MTEHTQQYLDTLTKSQRGELWIKSVRVKEPNYDTAKLWEIWGDCENSHETYEQEANKGKWLEEYLAESDASGEPIEITSFEHLRAILDKMHQEENNETKISNIATS